MVKVSDRTRTGKAIMNFVALKMLIGDRMKYIALVAGVAFAALLISQQMAIYLGFGQMIGAWIRGSSVADLWVMNDQVEFDNDFKMMQDTALNRVRGVDGVEWAMPMYKNYLQVRLPDGTQVLTRVIGIDDATLTGGPAEVTQGSMMDLRQDRAVLINEDQASDVLKLKNWGNRPLMVGDRISINDNDAVVVGTYKSEKEFFWDPVMYTTYSRAVSWAPAERRMLMYMLVKLRPGAELEKVRGQINAMSGLRALTNEEFDHQSTEQMLSRTGIKVNFGMMAGLGFFIGMMVAGQTFYTFVLDNLKLFGAMKAMGAANGTILRMMAVQVAFVGIVGYGLGVGLACLTGTILEKGGLAFYMTWEIPIFGGVAVILCSILAGVLGMIRVIRLEPAVVFK